MNRLLREVLILGGCFATSFVVSFGIAYVIESRRVRKEQEPMLEHCSPETKEKVLASWRFRNWVRR